MIKGKFCITLLTDFKKVFNYIMHNFLIVKFKTYGLSYES